jgi:hypothetical protein
MIFIAFSKKARFCQKRAFFISFLLKCHEIWQTLLKIRFVSYLSDPNKFLIFKNYYHGLKANSGIDQNGQ